MDNWNILVESYNHFHEDDGFPNSGNIAYCAILSIFPFIIFVFAIISLIGDEELAQTLIDSLLTTVPNELIDPLRGEITTLLTGQRRDLLTVSGLITIWTASRGVESLRNALNKAYRCEETRQWWVRVIQDFVIVVLGAIMVLLVSFSLVFSPVMWATAQNWIPHLSEFDFHFDIVRLTIGIIASFLALIAGHMFLPAKNIPLRKLMPGVAFSMALWLIMAFSYAYYLEHFAYFSSLYAGLSGLFAALIFIYLSATIFQFGGEINQVVIRNESNRVTNS